MRKLTFPILLAAAVAFLFAAQSTSDAVRRRIVEVAQKYKGVPYVYGAESPDAFDCSGFVRYVYREAAGLELPRNSKGQYAAGESIKKEAMKPGDVMVFDTVGGSPSHVALFLGGDTMIHAASAGPQTGIIVSPLTDKYFAPRFIGARRFVEETAGATPPPEPTKPSPPIQPPTPIPTPTPTPSTPSKPPATQAAPPAPPMPELPPTGKPTPLPQANKPQAPAPLPAPPAKPEPPIAQIGFTVTRNMERFTDKIPAAIGTGIAFTVTNGTGEDGRFVVIFYKAAKDFSKSTEIHRELTSIKAGRSFELPPYVFTEPGTYKLIVKDNWNTQLMERVFRVIEGKR